MSRSRWAACHRAISRKTLACCWARTLPSAPSTKMISKSASSVRWLVELPVGKVWLGRFACTVRDAGSISGWLVCGSSHAEALGNAEFRAQWSTLSTHPGSWPTARHEHPLQRAQHLTFRATSVLTRNRIRPGQTRNDESCGRSTNGNASGWSRHQPGCSARACSIGAEPRRVLAAAPMPPGSAT